LKILVIDDEQMILSLAEKILSRVGFDVDLARSGESGLEVIRKESDNIDIVLLDMTMPGLSGVDTLRKIREIKPEIPCIISTGQDVMLVSFPEDLSENTYFLEKPYLANQLTGKIKEILNI
jgi:DNA-binding NtrC family response regulator